MKTIDPPVAADCNLRIAIVPPLQTMAKAGSEAGQLDPTSSAPAKPPIHSVCLPVLLETKSVSMQ